MKICAKTCGCASPALSSAAAVTAYRFAGLQCMARLSLTAATGVCLRMPLTWHTSTTCTQTALATGEQQCEAASQSLAFDSWLELLHARKLLCLVLPGCTLQVCAIVCHSFYASRSGVKAPQGACMLLVRSWSARRLCLPPATCHSHTLFVSFAAPAVRSPR